MCTLVRKSEVTVHKGFTFLGISARTSNPTEMKGEGVIPTQWESFHKDQLMQLIPNKRTSSIIALYTDYESDETGSYKFALGAEVKESPLIPPVGMQKITIPESKYIIFTSRKGPVQEVVVETWQEIWEWSKNNERAFITDFEVYDERATDPQNSQIDIYISIK